MGHCSSPSDQSVALTFPLAALIFLYGNVRGSLTALCQGGIRWRGTFYSLRELRANKVEADPLAR